MDAARRHARSRMATAAKEARRHPSPAAEDNVEVTRRDYAAAALAEYIRTMVSAWPPLTAEQIDALRGLLESSGRKIGK